MTTPCDLAAPPLSFGQEALWFFQRLQPASAAYNLTFNVRLRGELDLPALERAFNEIRRRHDALRTHFAVVDGEPSQIITSAHDEAVPLVDLRHLNESERTEAIAYFTAQEAHTPFDLARGPLLRTLLLRVADDDHIWLRTMHHIIGDGWSIGIFKRELAALYEAFCAGESSPLQSLPLQFAQIARAQHRRFEDGSSKTSLSYWKNQLRDLSIVELPCDHARPAVQTFRGAHFKIELPATLTDALRGVSRAQNSTLFMALLAAFATLLHRYNAQDDIAIGSIIAERSRVETRDVIGYLVNAIVLRNDLAGDPTFAELLGRTREMALAAYRHGDAPFSKVVEAVQAPRDASRSPLFQVCIVFEPQQPTIETRDLSWNSWPADTQATDFDLTLQIAEHARGLSCRFGYNVDLFDVATIERMAGHYGTLLENIVANPHHQLSQFEILTAPERRHLLADWDDARVEIASYTSVHRQFEIQERQTPAALAVVFGDRQLSYGELNRRANQLAHFLRQSGVGPETIVAVCVERSIEMVIALLGIFKVGGAYLPIDADSPIERQNAMLQDSNALLLLTQEHLRAKVPQQRARVICLDSDWNFIAANSDANLESDTRPEDLAYVIYTSGSTGQPKGVMISHEAIAAHCRDIREHYALKADDRVLQFAAPSFDTSLEQILATLTSGATLIGRDRDVWTIAQWQRKIGELDLTVVDLPPAYWHQWMQEASVSSHAEENHHLRLVIVGGDVMSPATLRLWRQSPFQKVRLLNAYGPTETTITALTFEVSPQFELEDEKIPIGRPLPHRKIAILDAHGDLVPIGIVGELHIGGHALARGYLHQPALTAEKFIADPLGDDTQARLYKTGDLARLRSDGNVEFVGRIDHQVKIRGFRIETGEIETALTQHPKVPQAVVIARPNATGERRLVAYIVCDGNDTPAPASLRDFLRQKLPDYMIPAAFVFLDEWPLTPGGKVDRGALPLPELERIESLALPARHDMLEIRLAKIWEEILGVAPVGTRDNFFDLGGHSLLAVQLFARIEKLTGRNLPLATLFQAPTIEQLADVLRGENWSPPWSSLVPIQPSGSRPPFYCVHGIGGNVIGYRDLAQHLGTDQPVYGLQARGLDGRKAPQGGVEEMAAYYIDEIRCVQPRGPYFLGGVSYGGTVAFAMAQQLHAQGDRVGLVALFDTLGPDIKRAPRSQRTIAHWDAFKPLRAGEKRAYMRERLRKRIAAATRWMRKTRAANPSQTPAKKDAWTVVRTYGQPYPGRVILFRAHEPMNGISYDDAQMGWGNVAANLGLCEVPGNHTGLIGEPNVRVLAALLKAALNEAQSDG